MKKNASIVVLVLILFFALYSLVTDGSFSKVESLNAHLEKQQQKNEDLSGKVYAYKKEIHDLQTNNRALEKAARNTIGVAKDKEIIIVFDKEQSENK